MLLTIAGRSKSLITHGACERLVTHMIAPVNLVAGRMPKGLFAQCALKRSLIRVNPFVPMPITNKYKTLITVLTSMRSLVAVDLQVFSESSAFAERFIALRAVVAGDLVGMHGALVLGQQSHPAKRLFAMHARMHRSFVGHSGDCWRWQRLRPLLMRLHMHTKCIFERKCSITFGALHRFRLRPVRLVGA